MKSTLRSSTRFLPRLHPYRFTSTTSRPHATSPFSSPAPPRLPKEDQELYERLQRSSTGAFSTPKPTVVVNQSPATSNPQQRQRPQRNKPPHSSVADPETTSELGQGQEDDTTTERLVEKIDATVRATGEGEELHPNVRRGAPPEFEGERNPRTGETGGPKNDPLRWGGGVDWSYNGRVTDF